MPYDNEQSALVIAFLIFGIIIGFALNATPACHGLTGQDAEECLADAAASYSPY